MQDNKNNQDAFLRNIRLKAEEGDADAQYNLGISYLLGDGVSQDFAKAAKWCRLAADQGHADAQNSLGRFYLDRFPVDGNGEIQDWVEAVNLFRKAAEQGHPDAQFNLSMCFFCGEGVSQDIAEGAKWCHLAAEQGHPDAQYNLSRCFFRGDGVPQDYAEAAKWCGLSAEQGCMAAQNELGHYYMDGDGVTQDFSEGIEWFRLAAEQGHPEAQFNLGESYRVGVGVQQDLNEAIKWCLKAAEQEHIEAQFILGVLFSSRRADGSVLFSTIEDEKKGVYWYRKAAERGHAEAQHSLGKYYTHRRMNASMRGDDSDEPNLQEVTKDQQTAAEWFRKAAEQGHPDAEQMLANVGVNYFEMPDEAGVEYEEDDDFEDDDDELEPEEEVAYELTKHRHPLLSPLPASELSPVIVKMPVKSNTLGMSFKSLPGGTFTMGEGSKAHQVTLTNAFDLGVYAVTQEQYEAVMGTNPSDFEGPQNPVEDVSWDDAVEFCRKLSALPAEKSAGYVYRLPTEAEWEYACRAGTTSGYSFGDSESDLGDYGWYMDNSGLTAHPVGGKKPNLWGLYDMHGNMSEWCQDWYGHYPSGSVIDPTGAASGSHRVGRGGSWDYSSHICRSATRFRILPSLSLGFRVLRSSIK